MKVSFPDPSMNISGYGICVGSAVGIACEWFLHQHCPPKMAMACRCVGIGGATALVYFGVTCFGGIIAVAMCSTGVGLGLVLIAGVGLSLWNWKKKKVSK